MNTLLIAPAGRRHRRRHSADFKASVVQACMQPGVSIAAVALANGLNANMLRKWVIEAERASGIGVRAPTVPVPTTGAGLSPSFVPIEVTHGPAPADIRIEMQRGATAVKVSWPSSASAECAAWLRELLK